MDSTDNRDDFVNAVEPIIYDKMLKLGLVSSVHVVSGTGNAAIWRALEEEDDRDAVLNLSYLLTIQPPESADRSADTGWSPLHYAASHNKPNALKLLLDFNGDRDLRDNAKMTPLDYAKLYDHQECIEILTNYSPTEVEKVASQARCKEENWRAIQNQGGSEIQA